MEYPQFETILTQKMNEVMIITINRPNKLNALNETVLQELNQALDYIEKDDSIKVALITGSGEKAFVAGADITVLAQSNTAGAYEYIVYGHKLFLRIHEFPKPVIAMVNGYALGGGFELALACDMMVASENAKFGFPEITLNTMPGWGGTQLAARKLGLNRAKELVLTGKHYTADCCREWGFINYVTSREDLLAVTMDLANTLATRHAFSMKMAKDSVNRGIELDLANGFRFEAQGYAVNFSGDHAKEGFQAFLNRKK